MHWLSAPYSARFLSHHMCRSVDTHVTFYLELANDKRVFIQKENWMKSDYAMLHAATKKMWKVEKTKKKKRIKAENHDSDIWNRKHITRSSLDVILWGMLHMNATLIHLDQKRKRKWKRKIFLFLHSIQN